MIFLLQLAETYPKIVHIKPIVSHGILLSEDKFLKRQDNDIQKYFTPDGVKGYKKTLLMRTYHSPLEA